MKKCSFCGVPESEDTPLVYGENAYICENCVKAAYKVLYGDEVTTNDIQEDIIEVAKEFKPKDLKAFLRK